ncbi:MAG: hypothetical protein OXI30_16270 [Chloroflexota bacterium]|nr:hypothetical protein [Chloroflexota bacterium]
MATTEHTINDAIAELLRGTRWAWRDSNVIRSESTRVLADSPGSQPDILIAEANAVPVVIETEVLPAVTVEPEALARLGEGLVGSGRKILSSIAVRLPQRFRDEQGRKLKNAIMSADDLEFALYSGESATKFERYPQNGWLSGGINDLSLLVQSASMPPIIIERAADDFEQGVTQAANLLNDIAKNHPATVQKIADELHQQDSTQTRRMAMVILVNAFIFHEYLAGGHGQLADVRTLSELKYSLAGLRIPAILEDWNRILRVDYFPIFDIAFRILRAIPTVQSHELVGRLARTATELAEIGVVRSHDLTGTVFQKLISDRKFLAAFYTTPASAALLVGLAVDEDTLLSDGDWSNPNTISSLRIADFACGTGTLLTTAYQRISQLHELHGGNTEAIHPKMMARALVGCDILPAAAHLTASMLAGAQPHVQYDESAVFTAPYGVKADGEVKLGSIDLLRRGERLQGLEITARAIEATQEADVDIWRYAPHGSFDMVIMNPPFTRPNNFERRIPDTPNPNFAAFGATPAEQKAMAKAAKELTQQTIAHGSAGEASTFMALADRKLKTDGMLAMVMPLTLLSGSSWEKCRNQLRDAYDDLILISISGRDNLVSFSADTGMGDCLVIGQKSRRRQVRATFVILNESPTYSVHGYTIALQIRQLMRENALRRLEDGPSGGSAIYFGDFMVGQAIDAPLPNAGGWKLARIVDLALAQSAYQLASKQRLWLPTQSIANTLKLAITTVEETGKIGPYHLQVSKTQRDGQRKPFNLRPLQRNDVPTYPILSAHNADRERTMVFEADHDGIPYRARSREEQTIVDREVANVLATASHCHSNLDFQFDAQSTSMQFTSRKTIGGRAWISIQLASEDHEKALVLWANTILGVLMFWWHSSKQQRRRGILTKTTLRTLPILDVTALSADQLARATQIFDDTCQLPLKPLHELDIDENRKTLDRRFYGEVLGLPAAILADGGPLDILRQKLSREPSIRGSKPPPQTPPRRVSVYATPR